MSSEPDKHECTNMPPRYSIEITDDIAILFENKSPSRGDFHLIDYCPFCGKRFGEAGTAAETIQDELRDSLMCFENVGTRIMTPDAVLRAQRVYDALMNGEIQITIIDPALKEEFTPTS